MEKKPRKPRKPRKTENKAQEARECAKCKKYFVLETHHILPKCTFGENDQTNDLCPNCHAEYHRLLGKEIKNPDMVFHLYFYGKWLYGLLSLLLLMAVGFYLF